MKTGLFRADSNMARLLEQRLAIDIEPIASVAVWLASQVLTYHASYSWPLCQQCEQQVTSVYGERWYCLRCRTYLFPRV